MAYTAKSWLVSELTTDAALEMNEKYKNMVHNNKFDDLVDAVGKTLRDVKFHRVSPNVAVVYRKGDTHALGEVGYKNTKNKGNGELTYYVQSRRIRNDKYRDTSWQHFIVATKSLKNAVAAASTYLVPFNCEEAVKATSNIARTAISDALNKHNMAMRTAYKNLTGDAGYSSNMEGEFIKELRGHRFVSPRLNTASEEYYAAYDAYKDAEAATKGGVYYVGITESCDLRFVDTARVDVGYPYSVECFDRVPADSVADWVKGRVAVLSMTPPTHYVQGVGLRLDEKVFYVIGDKGEE